jgi:hypothetical protein
LKSSTALCESPEIFSSSSKNSWTASGGTLKLMLSNFHSARSSSATAHLGLCDWPRRATRSVPVLGRPDDHAALA